MRKVKITDKTITALLIHYEGVLGQLEGILRGLPKNRRGIKMDRDGLDVTLTENLISLLRVGHSMLMKMRAGVISSKKQKLLQKQLPSLESTLASLPGLELDPL